MASLNILIYIDCVIVGGSDLQMKIRGERIPGRKDETGRDERNTEQLG